MTSTPDEDVIKPGVSPHTASRAAVAGAERPPAVPNAQTAIVIDASSPKDRVLSEIKSVIWSRL